MTLACTLDLRGVGRCGFGRRAFGLIFAVAVYGMLNVRYGFD